MNPFGYVALSTSLYDSCVSEGKEEPTRVAEDNDSVSWFSDMTEESNVTSVREETS